MRLIDADVLTKEIEDFNCKDCNHYNHVRCRACQIDDALSYIDDAPTVEQPEIVRCEDCKNWIPGWIEDNDTFIPPRCKRNAGVWTYDDYCGYGDREMKQDD